MLEVKEIYSVAHFLGVDYSLILGWNINVRCHSGLICFFVCFWNGYITSVAKGAIPNQGFFTSVHLLASDVMVPERCSGIGFGNIYFQNFPGEELCNFSVPAVLNLRWHHCFLPYSRLKFLPVLNMGRIGFISILH